MTEDTQAAAQSQALATVAERGLAAYASSDDIAARFGARSDEKGVTNNLFLRFSGKTGEWSVKGDPVPVGSQFAFMLLHAEEGWQCWYDNKPVKTILNPIVDRVEKLPANKLPPLPGEKVRETDGWREIVKVQVRDLAGGPQMDFTLPAGEGWRPINRLIKEFGQKLRLNLDEKGRPKVPIVEITTDSYINKKTGSPVYSPILTIVAWMSDQELLDLEAGYAGGEEDVAPEAEQIAAPVTQQAPAQAAPAPAVTKPAVQARPAAPVAPAPVVPRTPGYRSGRVGTRV